MSLASAAESMPSPSGVDVCHCGIGRIVSRASARPPQQIEADAMAAARTSCNKGTFSWGMKSLETAIRFSQSCFNLSRHRAERTTNERLEQGDEADPGPQRTDEAVLGCR